VSSEYSVIKEEFHNVSIDKDPDPIERDAVDIWLDDIQKAEEDYARSIGMD